MTDLCKARKLASFVRLSEDKPSRVSGFEVVRGRENHRDTMLRHGVLISKSVAPLLEDRLVCV